MIGFGTGLALSLDACSVGPEGTGTAEGGVSSTQAVILKGDLLEAGVQCPQFRLAEAGVDASGEAVPAGESVSLTGVAPQDLASYALTGRWLTFSYCTQGRSFDVLTYARAAPK